MTIVYITVLDTFTAYDSKMAIIRNSNLRLYIVRYALLSEICRKRKFGGILEKMMVKWMIPLVIMIIGSSFLGWIVPKASPIWPDPVPFFKSYAGGDEKGGNKKSGC